jgi:hypothetical protein
VTTKDQQVRKAELVSHGLSHSTADNGLPGDQEMTVKISRGL